MNGWENRIFVSGFPGRIQVFSMIDGHTDVVHIPPQKMISFCIHSCIIS